MMVSELSPQNESSPGFKIICRHLLENSTRKTLCLQFIATVAAFASGAALPGLMLLWGNLADSFLRYARYDPTYNEASFQRRINDTALIMVYLFLGKVVTSYIYMLLYTMTAAEIAGNMRASFVKTVLKQSVATVDTVSNASRGGTPQVIESVSRIEVGLGEQLGSAVQLVSVIVTALIISLIQQWKLSLVVYTIVPLTVITVAGTVVGDVILDKKLRRGLYAASDIARDALANVRDVFSSTAETHVVAQYDALLEDSLRFGFKKAPFIGLQYASELFFVSIGYTLSFWYGTLLYSSGAASLGNILTIFFCIALANSSLTGISVQALALSSAFSAAQDLVKLLRAYDRAAELPDLDSGSSPTPEHVKGHIEFVDVDFGYPSRPDIRVCDKLSCQFLPGKTTAVVGASGSGKSTIVALIEKWFEIDGGAILLDGTDTRGLDPRWLRKQIGLVNQEPTLFQGTIYENVAYGLIGTRFEHLPEDQKLHLVENACELANASDFISGMPKGYQTWVGQNGGTLSGGQRQRIAIARAVVSNPRILILDEPTAALDARTEKTVLSALEKASSGRTCICVTHKPRQARSADYVFMFTPTGIAERGPPEVLMQEGGLFANFMAKDQSDPVTAIEEDPDPNSAGILDAEHELKRHVSKLKSNDQLGEQNQAARAADHALLKCIFMIMWGHRQHWAWMLAMFVPCVFGGLLFPAEAILFGRMVQVFEAPVAQVHTDMQLWVYVFLGLAFITLVVYGMVGYNGNILNYILGREHRLQYFRCIMSQNVAFFDEKNNSSGILVAKLIKHPDEIEDMLGRNIPVIIIILVTTIGCALLSIIVGWRLGLVSVFGCLFPVCIAGYVRVQLGFIVEQRANQLYYDSAGFAAESIAAMRTVVSLCLQDVISSQYRKMLQAASQQARSMGFVTFAFLALVDSLQICGYALTFWYGGTLLARREYHPDTFYTIFAAIIFGTQAVGKLFGFAFSFTKGKIAANHVLGWTAGLDDLRTQLTLNDDAAHASKVAIAFQDVHFKYPTRENPILKGLNFEIQRGQKVAFVGSSGSGKSTIFSLLEKFYEPTGGEIRLLGKSLQQLDKYTARTQIALVSQSPFLYKGSIKENLVVGLDRDVSDEALKEACQKAAVWDFIESLPSGFETLCGGNGGIDFSGGQRQRLNVARALLRQPQVLLLDEATSSLDVDSEQIITDTITQMQDVTVVANAHRLSTILNFDTIHVMEQGRIVESGTYTDLINLRRKFWHLVNAQR